MPDPSKLAFFLGGHDLEMVTIRDLVNEVAPDRLFDRNLPWGAKASAYRAEIDDAVASGLQPILVELEDDIGVRGAHVVVDHHGNRAGATAPTSLHQVFDLLELPRSRWTRWLELVAANDRGHIRELRRIGATEEEIHRIRAGDRAAQGITENDERAGENAIQEAQTFADGLLLVVKLPHAHTAVVADRLELGPDPPENLMVISPCEVNYYGPGPVVDALADRFRADGQADRYRSAASGGTDQSRLTSSISRWPRSNTFRALVAYKDKRRPSRIGTELALQFVLGNTGELCQMAQQAWLDRLVSVHRYREPDDRSAASVDMVATVDTQQSPTVPFHDSTEILPRGLFQTAISMIRADFSSEG